MARKEKIKLKLGQIYRAVRDDFDRKRGQYFKVYALYKEGGVHKVKLNRLMMDNSWSAFDTKVSFFKQYLRANKFVLVSKLERLIRNI